ncbi:diguanylate cyclase/phosphodiesterase [Clostridium aceticum]|uniref:Diguanylate cyclase/phosphodiesterase n=1 Tax=Clostridium aceticum TaxID=84022 RepID=A0A0G3W924_9CLOT|nr:EAL domain-containing protein [Clostridium aceticum]AKL94853.1 diguanylate cyclase/phosphodiesterase [Clostridium aceticum]
MQIRDKNNNQQWILVRGKGVFDENNQLKMINGIILDITKLKEQEKHIKHLAYHDPVTDLPNRIMFMEELEKEIDKNKSGAVMLLDLDNFKGINDTLGHIYGDKLLRKVAQELLSIKDKKLFISRFGGDEFLILLKEETEIAEIQNYAQKISDIFTKRITTKEEAYISCSIGITLYPLHSNDVTQLIMNADIAMYHAKNSGKSNYKLFNQELTDNLKEKRRIETVLREAIEKEEFKLLYQPQVCSVTRKVIGFEALLRLKKHAISPAVFIPVAEETGMIIEIGRWITKEVASQITSWKKKGISIKPIAINFSAKQMNDLGYINFLEDIFKEENVDPNDIEIEITESIFLENKQETMTFLNNLRALGLKIVLDDFGTGYSSLRYLTFLPVHKIKLDKSLNDKFLELSNIAVMESIISLAHSLNLKVVAEGIEDTQQYQRLKLVKCDYIQGYLFSKPLEVKEAEDIHNYHFLL